MSGIMKFRAWDPLKNEMIDFPSGLAEIMGYFSNDEQLDIFHRLEWMQCIGLEDRTHRDIYVGDILRKEDGTLYRVEWTEKFACVTWVSQTEEDWYPNSVIDSNRVEVIGNIYENPELLTT